MTSWRIAKCPGAFGRVVPVEETVARLLEIRHHYGIEEITDLTSLDHEVGLPVHSTTRSRSKSTSSTHAGKGLRPQDSMAGALAEAIEVDCAERFRPDEIVRGSFVELEGRLPVVRFTTGVPGGRGLPPDLSLEWTWVEDLLAQGTDRRRLLPLEFVQQGRLNGKLFDVNMSNGLASGNNVEEATVHALEELIERDATAIYTFRGQYCGEPLKHAYRQVAMDSLPPRAVELVARFARVGREVRLVDCTSDVGITTVLCWVLGQGVGIGCSLSSERAVIRSITEAAQTWVLSKQNKREDVSVATRHPRYHPSDFGLRAKPIRDTFLDSRSTRVGFESLPSASTPFVDADLALILERLRAQGIQHVYRCDVSDEHCGAFRVVRLIAPELESVRLDTIGPRRLRFAV